MFSKNLSLTILQLCSSRDLSYEKAAELCGLSPRYFGSVARGQTNASIITASFLMVSSSFILKDFSVMLYSYFLIC